MAASDTDLLRDFGRLLIRSHDLEETLRNVVRLVARWMRAGGCSIYLVEDDGRTLVLRATRGLRPEAVGSVRLRVGEGIVGAALEGREPIAVADARVDPRFLAFPDSGEQRFRSLVAVPLFARDVPVGVLAVQTPRPREFSSNEIELLQTIAAQVATIVLNARLLDLAFREGRIGTPEPVRTPLPLARGSIVRGIAIATGIAIGPVHIQPRSLDLTQLDYTPSQSRRAEWRAIERALREVIRQISDQRGLIGERFGEEFAEVFTTHIMILEDQGFRETLRRHVFGHGDGARGLVETMREYAGIFGASADPTIRERGADVEDVVQRVIGELLGVRQHNPPLGDGVIVVADRIAPSEFVLLETEKVAGIVTSHGGPTSHTAIFARSLEIPAVTGLREVEQIQPTDQVILDGIDGQLIVNPLPEQREEYDYRRQRFVEVRERLDEQRDLPARTLDGCAITLLANIGGLNDLELVRRYGARGVGLFRTEILALAARGFPDEEEQLRIYSRVAENLAPDWVTIRIFDLGGDKVLPSHPERESNPQLGWRSIRLLLDMREAFEAQLRAILRANARGNIRVLIPMLTTLEELDAAQARLRAVCEELGIAKQPPLGVMIETPAAVEIADRIAPRVDFFSIGTNDLVQYTLAVDRENERVAASYDPFHPAVLGQVRRVSLAAQAAGIPCAVCGELAGNPAATPVLLGMGIRELSMTPVWVMAVRQIVRRTRLADARELAADVARCGRASQVRERIARALAETGLLDDADLGPTLRRGLLPREVDRGKDGR